MQIFKSFKIQGLSFKEKRNKGFTFVEILIYTAIVSIVLLLVSSFVFYLMVSDRQSRADREIGENARRVLEQMVYEINGAKSVYAPTTSANQLSLETSQYLPSGENTTYIDFFICDLKVCLKKESQPPIPLTSDNVEVNALQFTRVSNNGYESIKINISVTYKGIANNVQPQISITSVASLRNQ